MELHPELARIRASAEAIVRRPVAMSGSGSTLFFALDAAAPKAARELEAILPALARIAAGLRVVCTTSADAMVGSRIPAVVAD